MAGANGTKQAKEDRVPTQRVVLQRMPALIIPPDATGEQVDAAAKALATKEHKKVERLPAWVERGEFSGSKIGAIEAYAGKPGTPDAKLGQFKAPTASAMKGGAKYSAPALPKVEREAID